MRKSIEIAERVSLEDMLNARESRSKIQKEMLIYNGGSLISFTLNIPGEFKVFPLAEKAFETGKELISHQLSSHWIHITQCEERKEKTGLECFYSINEDAVLLKGLMLEIEESHPLGRLFDIDVLDQDGTILKGESYGRMERGCLICGAPVWECSRSRSHSAEDLSHRTVEILQDYFNKQYAEQIAGKAVNALITEVCITPKPGLVDRLDNGAHKDMDMFTFINSATSLFSYFNRLVIYSGTFEGEAEQLLKSIRIIGRQAEEIMLTATKGVNTHKGAIFSLGIISAALGYMHGKNIPITPESLFSMCSKIANDLKADFKDNHIKTNGERIYRKHGITGIRGEAAEGFPHIRNVALPIYVDYLSKGFTCEQSGAISLLHLIAEVDDTNVIARSDLKTLQDIQNRVRRELKEEQDINKLLLFAEKLNSEFIMKNISPGGCADLLAATLFIYHTSY